MFDTIGFEPQITISRAFIELLGVDAQRAPIVAASARLAGGRADGAVEQRRAQPVEEAPVHRVHCSSPIVPA